MISDKMKLGCIADDFTGASDAASFLKAQNLRTILCSGLPKDRSLFEQFDAVVVALKTRSIAPEQAVAESLEALKWLSENGANRLYVKYCSTFDSTKTGNIGPVLDAALDFFGQRCTVLCPSLPVNGRTVKDGRLYVNSVPLDESHMKFHPLNPMWDSRLEVLMREQSKYPCVQLTVDDMMSGREHIDKIAASVKAEHFYFVPDYYRDEHADMIYSLFGGLKILSGGSGLLSNSLIFSREPEKESLLQTSDGKTLLLSGSCSQVTLEQVEVFKNAGNASVKIEPRSVIDGRQTADSVWNEAQGSDRILIYSSDSSENRAKLTAEENALASKVLEQMMAELAAKALVDGYTKIIVAGGETSGAVTRKLEFGEYIIGDMIAPGVPTMTPLENTRIRLVLKSGNFGQADFFSRAVKAINN